MTAADLNVVLDQLERQEPHPCGPGLSGRSPQMTALADGLNRAAELLARAGDGSKREVFIHIPDGGMAEADAVLARMQVDPTRVIRLRAGAPTYNSQLVFGSGSSPGRIEALDPGVAAVVGVERLVRDQRGRLMRHLKAWRGAGWPRGPFPTVLVAFGPDPCPEFDRWGVGTVRVPPLSERPTDLPHILDLTARRFGLSLSEFRSDVALLLLSAPWPGGLAEIGEVFDRLFADGRTDPRTVDPAQIHLVRSARTPAPPLEPHAVWRGVRQLCEECDRLGIQLIGMPFFRLAAVVMEPMADPHPPHCLARVIRLGVLQAQGGSLAEPSDRSHTPA